MNDSIDLALFALADPTRREILRHLAMGEATVSEVARPLPMSLNAVSKHVRVLESAGLLTRRRVWREHHLRINDEPLAWAIEEIEAIRKVWKKRLELLGEELDRQDQL